MVVCTKIHTHTHKHRKTCVNLYVHVYGRVIQVQAYVWQCKSSHLRRCDLRHEFFGHQRARECRHNMINERHERRHILWKLGHVFDPRGASLTRSLCVCICIYIYIYIYIHTHTHTHKHMLNAGHERQHVLWKLRHISDHWEQALCAAYVVFSRMYVCI